VSNPCVDLACLPNRGDVGQATIYTDANGPKQPGLITVRLLEMSDSLSERNSSFLLSRTLANHMLLTCSSHAHHILALCFP
jgi:hypothetical protein